MYLEKDLKRVLDGAESRTKLVSRLQVIEKNVGMMKPTLEILQKFGLSLWNLTLGDAKVMERFAGLGTDAPMDSIVELVGREFLARIIAGSLDHAGDPDAERLGQTIAEKMPTASVLQLGFSAFWTDQGCPVIQLPHTYAAALMATDPPADLSDVRPPWPAMMISVPTGMLTVFDEASQKRVEVRHLTVRHCFNALRNRMEWSVTTLTDSPVSIYRCGVTTAELLLEDLPFSNIEEDFSFALDTEDKRVQALMYRLIVNVCLAMTNRENVKRPKREPSPPRPGQKQPPETRVFKVGKPLTLDLRPKLAEYLKHGSKRRAGAPPSVQSLVSGHWKNQRFGKQHLESKWIWISPYWRGPDGAPILTRVVKLKGGKEE